jgi:hypothetical protein
MFRVVHEFDVGSYVGSMPVNVSPSPARYRRTRVS